jgi:hypothetical protein
VHVHVHDDHRPTQPLPQGNQTGRSPLGSGRCGWGELLAVLTAILGRGSAVVVAATRMWCATSAAAARASDRREHLRSMPIRERNNKPAHARLSPMPSVPCRLPPRAPARGACWRVAQQKQHVLVDRRMLPPTGYGVKQCGDAVLSPRCVVLLSKVESTAPGGYDEPPGHCS